METKMIKTTIIALCSITAIAAMEPRERQEFMRNGRQHAAGMSPEQRRAFMRDGHRHSEEYARKPKAQSERFSDSDIDMGEILRDTRKMSIKEKKKDKRETASEGSVIYKVKIKQELNNSNPRINIGKNYNQK
jgi:hypothetical protein